MPNPDLIGHADIDSRLIRALGAGLLFAGDLRAFSPGFGIQSKLEAENIENGAKLISFEQFCFSIFTECRSLLLTLVAESLVLTSRNNIRFHSR